MGGRGVSSTGGGYRSAQEMSDDTYLEAMREFESNSGIPFTRWEYDNESRRNVFERQGFDGRPLVVSDEELQNYIAAGNGIEIWRGVQGEDFAQQYRSGALYYGKGIYGHGTYTTTSYDHAGSYSGGANKSILHMALSNDAKVISHADALSLVSSFTYTNSKKSSFNYSDTELGKLVAAKGYDAIVKDFGDEKYYIVLNRTATVVSSKGYSWLDD